MSTLDHLDLRSPLAAELAETRERLAIYEAQGGSSGRLGLSQSPSVSQQDALTGGKRQRYHALKLYQAYTQVPWISGPIKTIANRLTSGGVDVVPLRKGANRADRERILDRLHYFNRWDNVVNATNRLIKAHLIVGEGMWEMVFVDTELFEFYYADPVTTRPIRDPYGNVLRFEQQIGTETPITIPVENMVYVPTYGARGEIQGPIELFLASTTLYNYMTRWNLLFFQNGAKGNYYVHMGEKATRADAERYVEFYDEIHAGVENAHRRDIVWGEMDLKSFTGGASSDLEYTQGLKFIREEFLTVLGVPPAAANISDDGSRLTDVSDKVDKQFQYNTIAPLGETVEEALTYAICKEAMGIDDWKISLPGRDYRADDAILKSVLDQVQNGVINRQTAAKTLGYEETIPGGKVYTITVPGVRDTIPTGDLEHIHSTQFVQAQQTAITTGLDPHATPADLAKASPRDPEKPGDTHPVAVQDERMDAQSDGKPKNPKESARADLARWQRIATTCIREGKPQRPFVTEHLDVHARLAITEGLLAARTQDDVRRIFDAAFCEIREDTDAPV